ncbi:MAG: YceI family protein [Acidobacteriaceae bacterium]|nr:YceI family protein [Acidobacteriaceae bacterium]
MTYGLALALCSAVLLGYPAAAQVSAWRLDPPHAAAQFSVRHMGISTVRGAFTKLSGTVQYDPNDPNKSSIDVVIDAASVDSRVEMRDNDLRSEHFLEVSKYPTITFKSKRVEAAGPGRMKITGDLTIRGVTKPVELEVEGPSEPAKDPRGNLHMGASATTKIDRRDFGMNGYQGMVGNEVSITLDVELVKPNGAQRQGT